MIRGSLQMKNDAVITFSIPLAPWKTVSSHYRQRKLREFFLEEVGYKVENNKSQRRNKGLRIYRVRMSRWRISNDFGMV